MSVKKIGKTDIFIGQSSIVEKIELLIDKAKEAHKPLPHLLLIGDDGMGKTTLAKAIGNEMDKTLTQIIPVQSTRAGDFVGIMTNLNEGDILLISDLDTMSKSWRDWLKPSSLLHYELDVTMDKGVYAKNYKFKMKPFTIIATTSNPSKLDNNWKKLFFASYIFSPYSSSEIEQIIMHKAKPFGVTFDDDALKFIVKKSGGVSTKVFNYANRIIKYTDLLNTKIVTQKIAEECIGLSHDDYEQETELDRHIPTDVREKVWRRDDGKCVKCGSQERLEFDHVIPVAKGGSNTARNIQILCEKCNREKSDNIA